ncbi:MAG: tetratricopeptide repeat protein, partial [Desulfobacterales bacterium]|nr:tetratricopeptide repeat protein [Desulfobacterales bacterium]
MIQKTLIKEKIAQIDSLLDKQLLQQAFQLLAQIDFPLIDSSPIEAGHLLYFTSVCLSKQSKFKEAEIEGRKAFEILRGTDQNKRIAQIQTLLGDIYCELGNPREAEAQYRDALTTFKRTQDNRWIITLHNALARICYIRSDFGRAVEYLKDGLAKA